MGRPLLGPQPRLRWTKPRLSHLEPRPIKIQDHTLDDQDKDNPDGLWASSVMVTDPEAVKGSLSKGLQVASGYVGMRFLSQQTDNGSMALYCGNIRG